MNANQFFDLTVKVRKAQKDYFAARKRRGYNAASKGELKSLFEISRNLERELIRDITFIRYVGIWKC